MKVNEVISELQKLDQERDIWISYDGMNDDKYGFTNGIFDPIPDDIVKQPLADDCKKYQEYKDVKVGDYLIKVGY